jgi:hypothetical protein
MASGDERRRLVVLELVEVVESAFLGRASAGSFRVLGSEDAYVGVDVRLITS